MEKRASACPLDCPDLCGLEVTVEGGRVIEVTGDHRGPITDGFICGKVRKIADHLYGSDRLLHPMVRVGAKGAGQWREVGWDEALDLVADRLAAIRTRSGAEAILPYHYGGSNGWLTEGALATRFFRRLGATTLERTYCAAATTAATQGMYGKLPGIALEDYVHAKLIVLWGVNPSATGIHSVPVITRARANGAKLVVIDPRATPLARNADLHLALRPGTDLPVALAILHALFERGHADRAFLARHAAQVDELARRASAWTLDAAAREAGIATADLDAFVELYAASVPAAIRCGYGPERNRNGGSAIAAILAIPAVAGKLGVRGGGYTMSNSDVAWDTSAEATIATPPAGTRVVNMSQLSTALRTLREPRIEALFVYYCNPAATAPDQRAVIEELSRDDLFVVVHEQVMTDTAELADVVLPATAFLEHRDLRRGYGVMRMYDSPAVATPPGEARSNNQLFGALAARLGLVRDGDALTDDELVARRRRSAGWRHAAAVRRRVPDDAGRQDPARPARARSRGRRALHLQARSKHRRVPARADLARALDADQLHVRPAPRRARAPRARRTRRRGPRDRRRRRRARLEPARRGALPRQGLDGRARGGLRAAEGAVAQAHAERLHRERADPTRPRRSGRPGRLQRCARAGREAAAHHGTVVIATN